MNINPIELSFPCPACGVRLTVLQTRADGPCPHCQIPIQVELKASLRQVEVSSERLEPEEDFPKNSFDRRRFRPTSHAAKVRTSLRQHSSKL